MVQNAGGGGKFSQLKATGFAGGRRLAYRRKQEWSTGGAGGF
jgi:hypothetical protein